jgi:hypothetical protein
MNGIKMTDEELQDYDDLKAIREAKAEEANAPSVSLLDAKKELGL